MKLLIVGSDKNYAIENIYKKYFLELGVNVILYPMQSKFYDFYFSSMLNKIFYRFGFTKIIKELNYELLDICSTFKPDLIWVFKGMEITPKTLLELRRQNVVLINFNPDNPFIFSGRGSGNSNIVPSLKLYDLHYTYNKEIQSQFQTEFGIIAKYLPFGFDYDQEILKLCEEENEILKVCFLGNPDKNRIELIKSIANRNIEIDVYGNNWKSKISHPNITCFQPVYGLDQWKILRKYRVQLNLLRLHNLNSHNMRTMEIPSIGGIQLAQRTKEHQMFFVENEEVFLFDDIDDCFEKINFLLSLSNDESKKIRIKAKRACFENGYSYLVRAKQVLENFETQIK